MSVGETLTIHGKNFRSGKAKNTVLFKRDKGKALFVKAGLSTKKKITIVIPKSLEKYMAVKGGKPTATPLPPARADDEALQVASRP